MGRRMRDMRSVLTCCLLFLLSIIACGRREDPVPLEPYKEIGVVNDLEASVREGNIYLTWGIPDERVFPAEAVKGFVIFRAELYEGETPQNCECRFRSLIFIKRDNKKTFEYLDKSALKGQTYVYKLVVMDKDNRMGRDSNLVVVEGSETGFRKIVIPPEAPKGLVGVYTQKSVVLTWDEVKGEDIKFYKVYRSEGDVFALIGESVTPAFTDRDVEPSRRYYYRVTAVAEVEGPPSKEIEILTNTFNH
jgi:hypothetical protein